MEHQEPLRDIFIRYLNNQCTPEEMEILLHHFADVSSEQALRQLVAEKLNEPVSAQQDDAALDQVYSRIQGHIRRTRPRRAGMVVHLRRIAAAAIICGAVFLLYKALQPPALTIVTTQRGAHRTLRLADSTTVWLGPASELSYSSTFNGSAREVTLKGEALFEVAQDPARPFVVHTEHLHTRVLGTTFSVKAYGPQATSEVTLLSGRVSVALSATAGEKRFTLAPAQRVVYNKLDHSVTKEDYPDAARLLAKKAGKLIYRGVALKAVAEELELFYAGAAISIPAALQGCTYYGDIQLSDNIQLVLQQIALAFNASVQQHNNRWEFRGGSCQ